MKLRDWLSINNKNLCDIKVDQAEIKKDLKHHIKRTELLEEQMGGIRKELTPIKTHIAVTGALAKVLVVIVTMLGVLAGIYRVFFL